MYSDDATDIIGDLEEDRAEDVLELMKTQDSTDVKELLTYDEHTAGGIMQKEFIDTLAVIGKWMNENGESIYG